MTGSLYLEDFSPGQTFSSEHVKLTADDVRAFATVTGDEHAIHLPGTDVPDEDVIGHGPWGLARYFGTVHSSGSFADSIIGLLRSDWNYRRPLRIGGTYCWETLVTGWRRTSSDPTRGVLHRDVRLVDVNVDGPERVVQEGALTAMVRASVPTGESDPASALPLSPDWGRAVVDVLEDDSQFHDATQLFDGTIGLSSPAASVQFRIYRGQVVETSTKVPRGADFTVQGSARAWCELLTGTRNDFVVRANRSEFTLAGDAYTYLQLTRALHLVIDAGRTVNTTGATA